MSESSTRPGAGHRLGQSEGLIDFLPGAEKGERGNTVAG